MNNGAPNYRVLPREGGDKGGEGGEELLIIRPRVLVSSGKVDRHALQIGVVGLENEVALAPGVLGVLGSGVINKHGQAVMEGGEV